MNPISTLVDGALSDVRDHLVSQPPSVRTTLAPVWGIPMAGQGGALATSVASDQIFPDRVGEIYHLAYNPGQRGSIAHRSTLSAGHGL
jgi:hypothetical protein